MGAEYWFVPAFALRAGYLNVVKDAVANKLRGAGTEIEKNQTRGLGFGMGVKFLGTNLDYAFTPSNANNDLGGTHRFGLTLQFGGEEEETPRFPICVMAAYSNPRMSPK